MNELLQKHGCSNVFTVPEGLRELMADISREVLRWQPPKLFDFIANYLSALLITREHGIMAVKIMDDLCDCKPTVSEHLLQIGLDREQADMLSTIIKHEIEGHEPAAEGKEKVRETAILKKVLNKVPLDEEMSAKVCQVARNAYRDYWYRKNQLEKGLKVSPEEPWQKAAAHTLEIYKRTKPSISELHRATEKIQAAYRGYHVRRNVLRHLQAPTEKKKKKGVSRKVELPGPPLDIATSREIDLGPIVNIKIKEDDVTGMFEDEEGKKLGLRYDTMKTITHEDDLAEKAEKSPRFGGVTVEFGSVEAPATGPGAAATAVGRLRTLECIEAEKDNKNKSKSAYGQPTPIADEISPYARISFAEAPPEVIRLPEYDYDELEPVPEMPGMVPAYDPNMMQGYDPNMMQGYEPNMMQQGYDPNMMQQGYDPNMMQGYDPNTMQSYDPQLTQIYDQSTMPAEVFEVPEEIVQGDNQTSSGPPSGHTTDVEYSTEGEE